MQINQLFPIPIGFFDLGRDCTPQELEFIHSLSQKPNMGNTTSENNYLLRCPEMSSLQKFFNNSAAEYFKEIYSPKYDVEIYVTQCWANYTKSLQYHHKHRHPNSFLSGVFYVDTDSSLDRIYFGNDRLTSNTIKITTENWNLYNSESWWFEAVKNRLIMFPSSLEHWVDAAQRDDRTRVSLSFNTFLKGTIGDNSQLTELII